MISGVRAATLFSCDFDSEDQFTGDSFCDLTQLTSDSLDWSRGASTLSANTGPQNGDVDTSGTELAVQCTYMYMHI